MNNAKWTKARCERELKSSLNWKIDFSEQYIAEVSFKFHSLHFVKFCIYTAHSDWKLNSIRAYIPVRSWDYMRHLFLVVKDEKGVAGLKEISRDTAIEMMMEALKKEGIL